MMILTDTIFMLNKNVKKALVVTMTAVILFTGCTSNRPASNSTKAAVAAPALSDQLIMSTLWFQRSPEAKQLYVQGYELARIRLMQNMERKSSGKPGAVILDIDETVLDNSPYEARLIVNGENYSPDTWAQWVNEARAEALPGVAEFLNFAQVHGIEIFYVSNRHMDHLEATIRNLQELNLPYSNEEHILLKAEISDKTERRERIKEEYEVLLYIGDQMTDFSQIYENGAEDQVAGAIENPDPENTVNQYFVLLPNPMYGSFENRIYPKDRKLSDEEKKKFRIQALDTK